MLYYLVIKMNKLWIHTATRMNLKTWQVKKARHKSISHFIPFTWILEQTNLNNLQWKKKNQNSGSPGVREVRIMIHILIGVWTLWSNQVVEQGFEPRCPGPRGHGFNHHNTTLLCPWDTVALGVDEITQEESPVKTGDREGTPRKVGGILGEGPWKPTGVELP